jgi:hypothetical protein
MSDRDIFVREFQAYSREICQEPASALVLLRIGY